MTSIDMATAQARADLGIQRTEDKAEKASPGWVAHTAHRLGAYAAWVNVPFTIEEARDVLKTSHDPDGDLRVWGAVTRMALRRNLIQATGEYKATTSSNGSPKRLYRCGEYV